MAEAIPDDSGLVSDGKLNPGVDQPPEAFAPSADMLTDETDPPLDIVDKGFGPVDQPTLPGFEAVVDAEVDEIIGDEPQDKPEEQADEPPPTDASEQGADEKQNPETVPYDRFQEVIQENQKLQQAQQVLDWITKNPEQAAARLGGQAPQTQPANVVSEVERIALDLQEPTPSKPVEDMDDTERAQLWVEKSSYSYLKDPLEKVVGKVNELLNFKEKLEETLTKNAVTPDGTPMHPRWDELKAPMQQVKARYNGISDAEAYHLADVMIPQSTPMVDDMAQYNQNAPPPAAPPAKPTPKRASPAAVRASKVASFGRSSTGMAAANPERFTAEQAAEKAFEEMIQDET